MPLFLVPTVNVESRILSSIKQRKGVVLLRSDLTGFGSASQVSASLKTLQLKGVIVRVGLGIYVKSAENPASGAVDLTAWAEDTAVEIMRKLGVLARVIRNDASTGHGTLLLDTGPHRIRRRLSIGGKSVSYLHHRRSGKQTISKNPALQIPTKKVSQFVARLARQHHITYARTLGDEWADTVTRLSGDEVQSDETGDLLAALKRAHKLTDREMTALLVNHLREKRGVRSV